MKCPWPRPPTPTFPHEGEGLQIPPSLPESRALHFFRPPLSWERVGGDDSEASESSSRHDLDLGFASITVSGVVDNHLRIRPTPGYFGVPSTWPCRSVVRGSAAPAAALRR